MAALSHGLPIVTTKAKKLPQGLSEQLHVVIVSPGDINGLTEAIKKLIGSDSLRIKLGDAAMFFSKRFSWEAVAEKHFLLYQDIVKK